MNMWQRHQTWYWVIFLVFAVLALILLSFVNLQFERDFHDSQNTPLAVSKEQAVIIRVLIDFGGNMRAFEGEAEKDMTLRRALENIADIGRLELRIVDGKLVSLGGKASGKSGRWNIYANDGLVSDMSRMLKGGDRIAIKYE